MKSLWIYKCNAGRKGEDGINCGDWRAFLELARTGPREWASTEEIKGAPSRKIIRERMCAGNPVLGWQTDRKEAVGLCQVGEVTVQGHPDGSTDQTLVPDAVEQFASPVRLHGMKASDPERPSVGAFGSRVVPATIYATTADEVLVVLDRCGVDPGILDG